MRSRRVFAASGRQRLLDLDTVLAGRYSDAESQLANKTDPLEEAVYIILSFQTDVPRLHDLWGRLRAAFPRWSDVESASLQSIQEVLAPGGLHRQKARTIRKLLAAVRSVTGDLSLECLHELSDEDAERFLLGLPGLSWKGARCVLLYSLSRAAFPVDVNAFRILLRFGILPSSAVYRRKTLHDALQDAVPASRRRRFHVNLVTHGQRTCTPSKPDCPRCAARTACAMRLS